MATSFTHIPTEIVGMIAGYLGLSDLRSLRFVCRDVSAKVTASSRFEGFCVHKSVELRKSSLEELIARLCEPGVQRNLEHLTITGVLLVTHGLERIIREKTKSANLNDPCGRRLDVYGDRAPAGRVTASESEVMDAKSHLAEFRRQIHTAEQERAAGHDLFALTNLFQIIKTRCKAAGLKRLTLDIVVRREPTTSLSPAVGAPSRQVRETAQHVLSVLMQAWHYSAIRIECLDVFSETEACGIQTGTLASVRNQIDFQNFNQLRALSLSINNRTPPSNSFEQFIGVDWDEKRLDLQRPIVRDMTNPLANAQQTRAEQRDERVGLLDDPGNNAGLEDWLRWTTSLEKLSIHSYWIDNTLSCHFGLYDRKPLFRYLTESAPLPHLRSLALSGANIETSALLGLLKNSPRLDSIDMREVILNASSGQSWMTVFAHITSHGAEYTHVYLDNLFEFIEQPRTRYVACFTPGTEPGYSISRDEDGGARLRRLGLVEWDLCKPGVNGSNAFKLVRREDVLRGIGYQLNPRYIRADVQSSLWMGQLKRNHGVPG